MADRAASTKEKTLNVAYLGPEASFSHQAAIEVFQRTTTTAKSTQDDPVSLHPLPSFPAIFSALQTFSISSSKSQSTNPHIPPSEINYDYALLPIENSTNGSVVQVLDLLAQCGLNDTSLYPDLEVCAEYYLPVHHCLFVSSTAMPSETHRDKALEAIRTIYTHPQVWGQCSRYLARFSPKHVERIDMGSTSAAAELVSREAKSFTSGGLNAAISSKLAGQRHDLTCLAENIEDEPGQNTTRFFVVRNKKRRTQMPDISSLATTAESSRHKSLITFTVPHTKPGALADTLAVFKAHGFNLTSIDTRPSRRRNWQYVFFVECEEASHTGNEESEGSVLEMVKDLGQFTESLRYLGRFIDRLPKGKDNGIGSDA